jgi:hypothetical protein
LKIPNTKQGWWSGSSERVSTSELQGPEFKPLYHKKKKKRKKKYVEICFFSLYQGKRSLTTQKEALNLFPWKTTTLRCCSLAKPEGKHPGVQSRKDLETGQKGIGNHPQKTEWGSP